MEATTILTRGGPDTLGLDLTASRESGVGSTLWTLGLGWYGLGG
jgi:hypothetical protein